MDAAAKHNCDLCDEDKEDEATEVATEKAVKEAFNTKPQP